MIQVLARKAIQFRNPNAALVNKQAKLGESDQIKLSTKLEEAFCRIIPDKVTAVPDWVKTDPIFDWCVKDGTLMEIVVNKSAPVSDLQAKGQQQLGDQKTEADKEAHEKAVADLKAKLAKMNKQELIDYAFENHDMDLSQAMNKQDILAAIEEARKVQAEEKPAA
jgi:hypothetical protein